MTADMIETFLDKRIAGINKQLGVSSMEEGLKKLEEMEKQKGLENDDKS